MATENATTAVGKVVTSHAFSDIWKLSESASDNDLLSPVSETAKQRENNACLESALESSESTVKLISDVIID